MRHHQPVFHREFIMPSPHTFTMKPMKDLVLRYVLRPDLWVDPFAGFNSPANRTNDLNPECPTEYHMEAGEFLQAMDNHLIHRADGILFDPPYSPRQISEVYQRYGLEISMETTQSSFWSRLKDLGAEIVADNGYAICFGWNTNGFGINRGFEMVEILLVQHGGAHNDTLVTVEQKTNGIRKPVGKYAMKHSDLEAW